MKQAIFLVTTIQGIRKPTFLKQLLSLISDDYQIVVLLAMTDFDEIWQAEREIKLLRLRADLDGVRTISLADVYADHDGVALKNSDYLTTDVSNLATHDSHSGKLRVSRYVDHDGNIVAETLFAEDETRLHTIFFDKNSRIIQINNYDHQNHLFGIEKFTDNFLEESLLLNAKSDLIFKFTNYVSPLKSSFAIASTSVIPLPQELTVIAGQKNDAAQKLYEGQGQTIVTKAISYSDYHRYDDINAFYHQVLMNMDIEGVRTYLDINDIVDASKYLPGKRIFNY